MKTKLEIKLTTPDGVIEKTIEGDDYNWAVFEDGQIEIKIGETFVNVLTMEKPEEIPTSPVASA